MKIKLGSRTVEANPNETLHLNKDIIFNSSSGPLGLLPVGIRHMTPNFMLLECPPKWVRVIAKDSWRAGLGDSKEYAIFMPWHYIGMTSGKSSLLWVRSKALPEYADFSKLSFGLPPLGNVYDTGHICMHRILGGTMTEWLLDVAHSLWERSFNTDVNMALRRCAGISRPFAFDGGIHDALERWAALDEAAVMALKWPVATGSNLVALTESSFYNLVRRATGAHLPAKNTREVAQ